MEDKINALTTMETMMDKTNHNRSGAYQHLFHEIMYPHEMLSTFSNSESISTRLCPYQYDERLLDLQDQLRKEFWRVVDEALTEKQAQVMKMLGEGYTQMEIAKAQFCNQSSIHKQIKGSPPINGSGAYGGSEEKLRKACMSDPKIVEILAKIDEIKEDKW